jgi:hypothetical protein
MSPEDILRSGLHDLADQVAELADLHRVAVQRGRRRRSVRRATAAGSAVLSVAAVAGVGVVVADNTGGGSSVLITPLASDTTPAAPWWQTWPQGRHYGPVDQAFDNYVIAHTEAELVVPTLYAAGSQPDGTDWAMYLSDHDQIFWMQGWDGQPDYGQEPPNADPAMTWTSWSTPTRAAHDDVTNNEQWLIIVGRPGTTEIDYSADGTAWTPLDLQDGIGVIKLDGFPPAAAEVRLSDANGVYATGTPEGAGAGTPNPSYSPTATATATPSANPTASPTTP